MIMNSKTQVISKKEWYQMTNVWVSAWSKRNRSMTYSGPSLPDIQKNIAGIKAVTSRK